MKTIWCQISSSKELPVTRTSSDKIYFIIQIYSENKYILHRCHSRTLKVKPYSIPYSLNLRSRDLISRVGYLNKEFDKAILFFNSRGRELNRVGFLIKGCSGSDLK